MKYEATTFMHNYAYARLPNSLLNMCTPLKTNSRNGNYLLKKYKGKYLDRFPSAFLPKIWNETPKDIKNILESKSAKNEIKKNILSSYETTEPSCNFAQCPDCKK